MKWSDEEIEYLINNYEKLNMKELENNLNHTRNAIRIKAMKLDAAKREKHSFWTEKEIGYLNDNYPNDNIDLLKLNLDHHNWGSIKKKANTIGLKREKRENNQLSIDEDFFKNWSKEMAYIFGFWIADGNIYEKKNKISFSSKDYNLMNIIKLKLKADHKIYKSKDDIFQLSVGNKRMYRDILNLGGIPRKSLIIQFPEVPDNYLSVFVRGYFDGDGSFYVSKMNKKYEYLAASFTGNLDFLTVLNNKLKEIGINSTGLCQMHKNQYGHSDRIYSLSYFNKKAIILGDYIYQNSENLRLERKFNIYDQMKKKYIKRLEEKRKI